MRSFTELWNKSLDFKDPEAQQRYVNAELPELCRQRSLGFHRCSDPAPHERGKQLIVGVAPYDKKDLELLDTLCDLIEATRLNSSSVMVFNLQDCQAIEDLEKLVPDGRRFPAQNPIVALWVDGKCVMTVGGFSARRWLDSALKAQNL